MRKKLLSILSLILLAQSLAISAKNTKTTVTQVTSAVKLATDVDYYVSGDTPFATAGSVDITNTEHAALIISKVKPSVVISSWLDHVYINGEQAKDGVNCQVRLYDRGAIILPYGSDFQPLTCYTEAGCTGESCSDYTEGHSGGYMKTLTKAQLNNNFKSFILKRGYMVTLALGSSGWGYSRCFIAHDEDLKVDLPVNMAGKVSSYRLFKWFYTHKAGLANNTGATAVAAVDAGWCYSFGNGESRLPDAECVAHHIYEDWPSSSACGSVTYSCHMKTNNEPGNSSDDHPQNVATVLNNWQNLMRTGMRLCSESSHDGSWSHLRAFIDSIDARGWRCDLLDLHCYWPSGSFGDFSNYYNNYGGRPIWISEWVWGASWNNNGAFATGNLDSGGRNSASDANQTYVYNGTVPILQKLNASKYVERYAYWNSEANCSKIYLDGKLTKLGEYYANMDEGIGYNASIQKVPTVVYSSITDLKGEYNKTKRTVTLTWTDANGDMPDSMYVEWRKPGQALYSGLEGVSLKDQSAKAGSSYTYVATPEAGANYYRVVIIQAGSNTKRYSNVVPVTVGSSEGSDMYQYGNLNVTSTTAVTTDFSESFASTPAVFMGVCSNKNTKLFPGNLVTSAGKSRFTYQILPWTAQSSASTTLTSAEEIPFLAMQDTTNYKFDDLDCEVGNAQVSMKDTITVTFREPFPEGATPVVLTELRNVTLKSNAICVRIWNVTNTGFKAIAMYEEGLNKTTSIKLPLCYLAITPGFGMFDKEKNLMIAAGHGDPCYSITYRSQIFKQGEDTLFFDSPYVFGELQTYNYHSATILRKATTFTVSDKESEHYDMAYAVGIKRMVDDTSTTTDKNTKNFGDEFGWVVLASIADGGSVPSAIDGVSADKGVDGGLKVSVENGVIKVAGADKVEVYSVDGAAVDANASQVPGLYIVRSGGKTAKVLVR